MQVFDGVVSLAYESLSAVRLRLGAAPAPCFANTRFAWAPLAPSGSGSNGGNSGFAVTDPWGTRFELLEVPDARGGSGNERPSPQRHRS